MVDLVCIDVDGTLVGTSGSVPPAVWDAARALRERGVRLAICSGRPAFGLAREYAERLDPHGWHVFQNGASVVHLGASESRSRCLPSVAVDRLVARARETGRDLELYTDDEYAAVRDSPRSREHARLLGVPYSTLDVEALHGRVVRALWLVPHDELEALLDEPHAGLTLGAALAPSMPDTVFVNVTLAGVDKAEAVRRVADAYGIPLDRVMMVGDGANDADVMRIVGVSVAMGNAEPIVHEVARHAVPHVDAGGLVEALRLAAGTPRS